MNGWRTSPNRVGDIIHVHPVNDLIPHELTDECVCGPRTEIEMREGRRDKHIYVHASLDGREHREGAA